MLLDHAVLGKHLDFGNRNIAAGEFTTTQDLALGAAQHLPDPTVSPCHLAALAVDVDAIAVVVIDAEEIVLVARDPTGASAHADGGDRGATDEPIGYIEIVDVLFHDVVARHFDEVDPVAQEVVAVGLSRLARGHEGHGAVPHDDTAKDFTDRAGLNLSLIRQVVEGVATLGAGDEAKALGAAFLAQSHDVADSWRIDGNGLFQEDVLVGGDCRGEVNRAEVGRCGEDDEFGIGLHHLLVGVRTHHDAVRRHGETLSYLSRLFGKNISHRHNLDLVAEQSGCFDKVGEGAAASPTPTTTTNEGYLEGETRSLSPAHMKQPGGGRQDRGFFQEVATGRG